MRRRIPVAIAALAVVFASAGVIYAITNGWPDGDNHPYVGVLVFDDANGPAWMCTGSLIAPTVVLTAGHCTYGAVAARIWFVPSIWPYIEEWPGGGPTSISGTPYAHPAYASKFIDVGVVVLDEPVTDKGFAQLPDPGVVDTLAMKADIDLVGYGVQWKERVPGPPRGKWAWDGLRYYARSQYVASEDKIGVQFLKLTANPASGKGGVCFGDSGGPSLVGGSNLVLAVNSFVNNSNCAGVTYSMRVDRTDVLDWVNTFLP
jgi:hypothetical protein